MDNTLSLLYSAAIARGLPHRAMRNLRALSAVHATSLQAMPDSGKWEGQLTKGDPKYKPAKLRVKEGRQKEKILAGHGISALTTHIGMTEGYGGITLGRVQREGKKLVKKH